MTLALRSFLRSPRTLAATAALATFVALAALAEAPGVSRDEGRVLAAATGFAAAGASAPARPEPPLAARVAAAGHAVGARAGLAHLRALRIGTAAMGALASALLVLLGHAGAGGAGAVLALGLFWLAPRPLHAGLVASPDLAAAALALAVVWAWRCALGAERGRAAAAAGAAALFGALLAFRLDAWTLAVALALHAALTPRLRARSPIPLAAVALGGPALLLALWPWLLGDPLRRLAAALAPASGAHAGAAPLVLAALTVPAAALAAYAGGVLHAIARRVSAARGSGVPAADDDLLLVLAAAAPLAATAAGIAPGSGIRPVLSALPFLALLGARALVAAAALAWPARWAAVTASVGLLALYPGLRATVHAFPAGASAWSELAGGAPGAASRGLPRQDGGEASAAATAEVNARARAGARIWWPRVAPEAVRLLAADGRLRPDLVAANGPEDADVVVVPIDGADRDDEYRAWAALRTARPTSGVYLDEVPLVLVYARAGAWR
jgi:hypothetical protein